MSDTAKTQDPGDEGWMDICSTKGLEVVHVRRLTFIRKRKRTEEPTPMADPPCGEPGAPAIAGPHQAVSNQEEASPIGASEELQDPKSADAALSAEVEPLSAAASPPMSPPQRHDDLKEHPPTDPNTRQVVDATQPHAELARSTVQEADLQATVANLVKCVLKGCPTAVSMEWLLNETLRAVVPPGDEVGTATAAAIVKAFRSGLDKHVTAAKQLLLLGGADNLERFDGLPPMVRSMCAEERLAAVRRLQLVALEREEAAWKVVAEKYSSGTHCFGGDKDHESKSKETSLCNEITQQLTEMEKEQVVNVSALEVAKRRAALQVSIQVESLNSMLERAEAMVYKAQRLSASLQVEYHKKNFQSYAHVNSPHVLVRNLSQALLSGPLDFVPASQPSIKDEGCC